MKLCPTCLDESMAWLDYRIPRPLPRITNHGASGDSLAAIKDRRKTRTRQWQETIRFERRLIADRCSRFHGGSDGSGSA